MTWFLTRLVCFIAVFSDGGATEFYRGKPTPVNNNRVAFARANGNTSNVKLRYKRRNVVSILSMESRREDTTTIVGHVIGGLPAPL